MCGDFRSEIESPRIQDPDRTSHIKDQRLCHRVIIFDCLFMERKAHSFRSISKRKLMWNIATLGREVWTTKKEPISSTCGIVLNTAVILVKQSATFSEHLSLICEIRRSKVLVIVNHPLSASSIMIRTK